VPTVAVTRMGFGSLWLFSSRREADEHPLIQYGDAILTGPGDIERQYTNLEIPLLCEQLQRKELADEFRIKIRDLDGRTRHTYKEQLLEYLWVLLTGKAVKPPIDPTEVFRLVIEDRRVTRTTDPREKLNMARRPETAQATVDPSVAVGDPNAAVGETTAAAASAPAAPKAPKADKGPDKTKIVRLLNDKEGKAYGADNNPKKAGGTAAARFALYVNGMTVGAALDAGVKAADIDYDRKKGFIELADSV
jgi:hypothetical protein